jgi:hypothetical protein
MLESDNAQLMSTILLVMEEGDFYVKTCKSNGFTSNSYCYASAQLLRYACRN